jgi:CheY-like chemotaxis protein
MISVLYVDDEHDLLEIGKLFLEQYPDLRVDVHTSAKEALASPLIGKYDAIVSDYQMPEMDGIEFLKYVRGKYGDQQRCGLLSPERRGCQGPVC